LSAAERLSPAGATRREAGDSFAKMLTGIAFLSVAVTALYGAFTPVYRVIRSTREDLRASQIVMQKAEALRLFTRSQVGDTNNYRQPFLVEPYNPRRVTHTSGGVQYAGYLSTAGPAAAGDLANTSRSHLRSVTVTLCWTNSDGAKPVVHRREMQARLAPNGMPKYLWEAL